MISRLNRGGRTGARAIVIFGAVLLLVSQMIGVAHFHEGAVSRDGIGAAQVGTDSGLCPICQLALHAPGSLAQATTVARGPAIAESDIRRRAGSSRVAGILDRARARSARIDLKPLFDTSDFLLARAIDSRGAARV